MAIPRIRYAFCYCGSLRRGCLVIFILLLLVSTHYINIYTGMNGLTHALRRNAKNFSQDIIDEKKETYITVSTKGSFVLGSIGSFYFVLSIYGLIGIIGKEIHLLIAPMIMLPFASFMLIVLIFFDMGVQENAGFLFFWVFTGFVTKIIMAAISIYSFIVVFSYYKEKTEGPPPESETKNISASTSGNLPKILDSFKFSPEGTDSSPRAKTPPPRPPPPRTPPPRPPPPRTPPPRPPPPKTPPSRPIRTKSKS